MKSFFFFFKYLWRNLLEHFFRLHRLIPLSCLFFSKA